MISVDEALSRIDAATSLLPSERVVLHAALGRVLALQACSAHDLPLFDQSAVDGYAVRHADLASASTRLPLGATIAAAAHAQQPVLAPGTAARIFTGGLLPDGADTVVRQERARREQGFVNLDTVAPGSDIRRAGEEMHLGATIAAAGTEVTPGLIGALSMGGAHELVVRAQPRIVVLVTGDEVVAPGTALKLGQVPDANGPLLAAYLRQWGCPALRIEAVADREDAVIDALQRAFVDADLVLTTGGVSVGDFDFVPKAAEALGAERLLCKIAQKPGMPLYVAKHGNALLFGLPGNPASVLVNLHIYVRHALLRMLGSKPAVRWQRGRIMSPPKRESTKTFWLRAQAQVDAHGEVQLEPLRGQGSHMLGNLAQANALVRVPGRHEVAELSQILSWTAL